MFNVVSKITSRVDGEAKARGLEKFPSDIYLPGMLFAAVLRSPHPHAEILKIDTSEAEGMGAVCLTPDDVPDVLYNERGVSIPARTFRDRRVLPKKARHFGEAIAAVAAPTEELTFKALKALKVEYRVLPPVLDPVKAMEPSSPQLYEKVYFGDEEVAIKNNIACEREISVGNAREAIASSDFVIEEEYSLPRVYHFQMETKSAVCSPDNDGSLTIWCTTQSIHNVRILIGSIFGIPLSKVNVKRIPVGGSFGSSIQMNSIIPICAALALKSGKPVKLVSSREEDMYDHCKYPSRIRLKVGVNRDMTIQGVEAEVLVDIGAHQIQAYPLLGSMAGWLVSLYKWKNLEYRGRAIYTNKVPACAMQGYGNPQMNFAVESHIDLICEKCGFDPMEFRLKNYVGVGDEFWGQGPTVRSIIKSCGLEESLKVGSELIDWKSRGNPREKTGRFRRGIGLARGFHTSGAGAPGPAEVIDYSGATVKINEDGSVDVITAVMDLGGGTWDAILKIVAEELCLPLEKVNLSPADTRTTVYDVCTHASRGVFAGGGAAHKAAREVKKKVMEIAGTLLGEHPENLEMIFDPQRNHAVIQPLGAPSKSLTLGEVARLAMINGLGSIASTVSFRQKTCPPSFVTNFIEVEVDTLTGRVRLVKAVCIADCGTPVNPDGVKGQLIGSLARYGGYALCEEGEYNDQGRLKSEGFVTDNKIFTSQEMPLSQNVLVHFTKTYEPTGPLGAKGIGEAAGNSVASAIANAVSNALGIRFTALPITPEKVLSALKREED
ncbi:MAG: molybdopterin-dependent oxidoreductase [Caldiserica bacterium]|jgi:xanthine dehydrogenase molybdenum-binding subunit|nr:molybdopterin-dependent oxidoreductase [Caldisericota bacterium]MDH7563045.1 molybdopterin-dependent oxidoreductase [Caldisericota bacterium]